jgi:PHD/YefM family antitoxin component YafN of YafNO toxin-antitoxin module
MNVTMPLADAQKSLASITRQIKRKGQRVVLETRGKPQVALISLSDLEQLQNGKHHIVLEHEWPALLVVLRQLRAALQAKNIGAHNNYLKTLTTFWRWWQSRMSQHALGKNLSQSWKLMYRIVISASAEKDVRRLPRAMQMRARAAIEGLRQNPRPHGAKNWLVISIGDCAWAIIASCMRLTMRCVS